MNHDQQNHLESSNLNDSAKDNMVDVELEFDDEGNYHVDQYPEHL